jgi:hypothetical protein
MITEIPRIVFIIAWHHSDGIGWGFHDQLADICREIEVEFGYNEED